ncbi:MAG TPA: hypothetical protein VL426_00585 [Candidatus Binatia bacterium]|nr:hypothetical protein [Candidatus Binatia bacterium]
MNPSAPTSPKGLLKTIILPLLVIAAFAGGFLLRGPVAKRPATAVPVPRAEERLAVPDAGKLDRYLGVVEEVGPDSVVVMTPDAPGPRAEQHLVTLRVTQATRINSILGEGVSMGAPPEKAGVPASITQILKNDVVGFTGGSPFGSDELTAATITIIGRPPAGTAGE